MSRNSKKKPNYYVVTKGEGLSNNLQHGIFTEWAECSKHVIGVKGAMFQGCQSLDAAIGMLIDNNLYPILIFDNGKWTQASEYEPKAVQNENNNNEPPDTCNDNVTVTSTEQDTSNTPKANQDQPCAQQKQSTFSENRPIAENTNISPQSDVLDCNNNDQLINSEETCLKTADTSNDNQFPENNVTHETESNEDKSQNENKDCALCPEINNDKMLECTTCKSWVHYECTNLPKYELTRYIRYKSRKYSCQICVTTDTKNNPYFSGLESTKIKPDNSSLVKDMTDAIKSQALQFTKTIQDLEKSFVTLTETVTKNINALNDRTDNIDKELSKTKMSVEKINKTDKTQSANQETICEAIKKLSNLKNYEDQSACIKKLESENNQLRSNLNQSRHDNLLTETQIQGRYEGEIKTLKARNDGCERHIKTLCTEIQEKSTVINEILSQNTDLKTKMEMMQKDLDEAKDNVTSLRIQIAQSDKHEYNDWSTVEKTKPKTPKLLLIGSSNTANIDPAKLSSKYETTKETAYTIKQAEDIIDKSTLEPDVIAFHVLGNDLKSASSTDVASRLEKLVFKTKEKKPSSKIVISLATNRKDDKKYNLKVNTINSIVKESAEDSTGFTVCDHSNLSHGSEIRPEFITGDGVHLSNDGVSLLASNIRKSVDKALNIRTFSPQRRPPNRRKQWQRRQQGDSN